MGLSTKKNREGFGIDLHVVRCPDDPLNPAPAGHQIRTPYPLRRPVFLCGGDPRLSPPVGAALVHQVPTYPRPPNLSHTGPSRSAKGSCSRGVFCARAGCSSRAGGYAAVGDGAPRRRPGASPGSPEMVKCGARPKILRGAARSRLSSCNTECGASLPRSPFF